MVHSQMLLKFGLSEKHTKFEKKNSHAFDKSADLLCIRQNCEEIFFKLYVLLEKSDNLAVKPYIPHKSLLE